MSELQYLLLDVMDQLIPHLLYATKDLDERQRYYSEGTNNPIAFSAWHLTRTLEQGVLEAMAGRPSIWEAKGYRTQLSFPADQVAVGITHEQVLAIKVEPWSAFLRYMAEVLTAVRDYVSAASGEELEATITGARIDSEHPRGDYSKARIIRGRLTHASVHLGEIYAIRGALRLKGSPI